MPLVRYVDDILVLCRSKDEAYEARDDLEHILVPAGMPLKGTPKTAVHDLAAGTPVTGWDTPVATRAAISS